MIIFAIGMSDCTSEMLAEVSMFFPDWRFSHANFINRAAAGDPPVVSFA